MISFNELYLQDGIPIYQQILTFIKRGIIAGKIQNEDELPSRRVLSSLLGVNPNTIQKAYRMLEEEGLIKSSVGAKSCVVLFEETLNKIREELLKNDAQSVIEAMKQMGITKSEALSLIENYWEGE